MELLAILAPLACEAGRWSWTTTWAGICSYARLTCLSTQLANWSKTFLLSGSSRPLKNWLIDPLMNSIAFVKPLLFSTSSLKKWNIQVRRRKVILTTCSLDLRTPPDSLGQYMWIPFCSAPGKWRRHQFGLSRGPHWETFRLPRTYRKLEVVEQSKK